MFDFVRRIIKYADAWSIKCVIREMQSLIYEAEEKLKELENGDEEEDEDE